MNIIKTTIEGLVIIEPKVYQDERGYFFESFNANEFAEKTGISIPVFIFQKTVQCPPIKRLQKSNS